MLDERHRPEEANALTRRVAAAASALLIALVAAGCADDDAEGERSSARPTTAAQVGGVTVSAAAAAARRVEIMSPRDGETVTNPVELRVDVSGFDLVEPDGDTRGATGHLHAFVDREQLPPAEQIIPSEPDTVDFWTEGIELLDLPPGRHTITVVASDGYRVPFRPPVWDRITVTVR